MDVVSDIEGEMADITLCCHVCDVVYSVCDVMNAVDVMWLLQWCEFKERLCHYVWCIRYHI